MNTVAESLKEHLPGIVSSLSAGNATINKPNPGEPVFINISPIQGGTWSVQVDQIDKIGLIKGSEQYVGYTEELFNHLKMNRIHLFNKENLKTQELKHLVRMTQSSFLLTSARRKKESVILR